MIDLKNKSRKENQSYWISFSKGIGAFLLLFFSSLQFTYAKNNSLEEYDRYLHYVDSVTERMYNFNFKPLPFLSDSIDAATRMVGLYDYYYQYLSAETSDTKAKFDALLNTPTSYKGFNDQNVKLAKLSEQLVQMRYARARGNYLSSAILFNDVGNYFNTNKMDSTISLSVLYWGLYSFYLSAIKEENFILRGLLSGWKSPNKDEGLKILTKLTEHQSRFISTEARYFLMRGLWELEEKPKEALLIVNSLCQEYPNNLLYHWFRIRIIAEISGEDHAQIEFNNAYRKAKLKGMSDPVLKLFEEKCAKIWD